MKDGIRTEQAACHSCHGGCGAVVGFEGDRLVKIRPDPEAPLNRGRMCVKGLSGIQLLYHPQHLNFPTKRAGGRGSGKWERVTWDEAYGYIEENIRKIWDGYGKQGLAVVTGTGRHYCDWISRFGSILGTPNFTSTGAAICLGPRKRASEFVYGTYPTVDYYSGKYPSCIMVWGSNPVNSGADGELQFHIWDALKAGSRLLVVDPLPTELTRRAALWLRPRPGTDAALALGILNEMLTRGLYDHEFAEKWTVGLDALKKRCAEYPKKRVSEITWVPEEQISRAAELLFESAPVSLEWGCALEQTMNSVAGIRAICMIPGLLGSYDVPGGFLESMDMLPPTDNLQERYSPEMNKKRMGADKYPVLTGDCGGPRFAHPVHVLRAMRDGKPYPIKGALLHTNILSSTPNARLAREAMDKLEFICVMDQFMSPTAALADIVLPAASWLELDNVYTAPNGGDHAVLCEKQLTRVGERKSDEEFFFELTRRMGLDPGAPSLRAVIDERLAEMGRRYPQFAGLDLDGLKKLTYVTVPLEFKKYEKRGFMTPSGKMELYSERLLSLGYDPLPGYIEPPEALPTVEFPFVLTTGRRQQQFFVSEGRQIPMLRSAAPYPLVTLHPEAAAEYGIADGDWIFIENQRGRITQKARLSEDCGKRVVSCQLGWWYPEADAPGFDWDVSNCNILTSSDEPFDPVHGSYTLRGLRCRIYKNPDGVLIEERYEKFDKSKWTEVQNGQYF